MPADRDSRRRICLPPRQLDGSLSESSGRDPAPSDVPLHRGLYSRRNFGVLFVRSASGSLPSSMTPRSYDSRSEYESAERLAVFLCRHRWMLLRPAHPTGVEATGGRTSTPVGWDRQAELARRRVRLHVSNNQARGSPKRPEQRLGSANQGGNRSPWLRRRATTSLTCDFARP